MGRSGIHKIRLQDRRQLAHDVRSAFANGLRADDYPNFVKAQEELNWSHRNGPTISALQEDYAAAWSDLNRFVEK